MCLRRNPVGANTGESNALDVHIYNLRKKVGTERIGTVRGVGYVLETR